MSQREPLFASQPSSTLEVKEYDTLKGFIEANREMLLRKTMRWVIIGLTIMLLDFLFFWGSLFEIAFRAWINPLVLSGSILFFACMAWFTAKFVYANEIYSSPMGIFDNTPGESTRALNASIERQRPYTNVLIGMLVGLMYVIIGMIIFLVLRLLG